MEINYSGVETPMQCGLKLLENFKIKMSPVAYEYNQETKDCTLGHLGLAPGKVIFTKFCTQFIIEFFSR